MLNPGQYTLLNRAATTALTGENQTATDKLAGIPVGLPLDMPKAWFVALAALSKSATPKRVRESATRDHPVMLPSNKKGSRQ